ncbi:MAG: DMT family transporter [bacterium]|nr:DMT family transporter [bacterium]
MQVNSWVKQLAAFFTLFLITVAWGSTFILVKWAILEMDLYYFLFLRFLVSFLLLALFYWKYFLTIDRQLLKSSLILGLLMGIAYITQTEGLRFTTASNSSLITGLYLILIPIFSAFLFKERFDAFTIVGVILSLTGLVFLTQYNFQGFNLGDALSILCAIAYSWHVMITGRVTHHHPAAPLVMFQFLFITVAYGLILPFRPDFSWAIPKIGWITLFITSVFATALAFVVQTVAQRYVQPTQAGIIFSMEAVFGAFFGYWLGGEIMTRESFFGASLMVLGMFVASIQPVIKRLTHKTVT